MMILFLAASTGATLIVTLSSLFEPLRDLFGIKDQQRETNILEGAEKPTAKEKRMLFFKDLFHCPMCFGFWMGLAMYLIMGGTATTLNEFGIMFAHGCATSLSSIVCYSLLKR
jgi:hypothetical protein